MRLAVLFLAIAFSVACGDASKKPDTISAGLKEKMIGQWTSDTSGRATIDITADSIYYIDQMNRYQYQLVPGDSISIRYPFYTYLGKISFAGDTLLITDGNGVSRFTSFKGR